MTLLRRELESLRALVAEQRFLLPPFSIASVFRFSERRNAQAQKNNEEKELFHSAVYFIASRNLVITFFVYNGKSPDIIQL